jgi:type I restriction enzyme M protein
MNRPSWFRDDEVLIVNARTCGLNKDGVEQYVVDPVTGARLAGIDDQLASAVASIRGEGSANSAVTFVPARALVNSRVSVPTYYDGATLTAFEQFIASRSTDFESATLGELIAENRLLVRKGHGSPSADQRVGDIPYIKVSDLRAGQINVNPSNRIPRPLAEQFWRGTSSGLEPYDLICPERASKNIGEFCVLLPGQEELVLTKEVLIVRGCDSDLSQFYLMWAFSLAVVRAQWSRVIFMQTNREDVGSRFKEIRIPVPRSADVSTRYAAPFEEYFRAVREAKRSLREQVSGDGCVYHLFFA